MRGLFSCMTILLLFVCLFGVGGGYEKKGEGRDVRRGVGVVVRDEGEGMGWEGRRGGEGER